MRIVVYEYGIIPTVFHISARVLGDLFVFSKLFRVANQFRFTENQKNVVFEIVHIEIGRPRFSRR